MSLASYQTAPPRGKLEKILLHGASYRVKLTDGGEAKKESAADRRHPDRSRRRRHSDRTQESAARLGDSRRLRRLRRESGERRSARGEGRGLARRQAGRATPQLLRPQARPARAYDLDGIHRESERNAERRRRRQVGGDFPRSEPAVAAGVRSRADS